MALLGKAALAMWWDMAPAARAEFAHWHAHEHFPERLAIPGFQRASRWACADGGDAVFVLYELHTHAVLSSAPYLARLNAPSAWSTRMMPHHQHMVRSQCQVLHSRGAGMGAQLLTLRIGPQAGHEASLRDALQALAAELVQQPGLVGLHVLRHQAPVIAQTTEQQLRGLSDRVADWVLLVSGYDRAALDQLSQGALAEERLVALGAAPASLRGRYTLAYTAVPADLADLGPAARAG